MRMALAVASVAFVQAAPAPDVGHLVLVPSQVGKGYIQLLPQGGKMVKGQVTLNVCGVGYQSERFRTTRIQLNYAKPKSPIGISNEVVTYRSNGAADAMREIAERVDNCPHRPIDTGAKNLPKLQFAITRISDPRLLEGSVAMRIVLTGTVNGKHIRQVSYAVYQRHGNVLSGVYSFGADTPAQEALVLHAAEQSARNLRRGAPGATSGPAA